MKYTVPDIPPSNNKFIGRTNRWEYQEVKKQWCDLIALTCRPRPHEPLSGVTVKITYYFKTNVRHDPDNYSGKMILDGLTRAGIIKDDSFNCINLVLVGDYDKKNPRTEIEITKFDEKLTGKNADTTFIDETEERT